MRRVFDSRGHHKATVAFLRKMLPWTKVFSNSLLEDRLHEAGLKWMRRQDLVQDFERCLRSKGLLQALEKLGVELVEGYPKCSQDFSAIENCWKILEERLSDTMPRGLETRAHLVDRLKKAVGRMNRVKAQQMWYLATNQKHRCEDGLSQVPPGGRTKW